MYLANYNLGYYKKSSTRIGGHGGRVGLREGKQIVVIVTDTIQLKESILGTIEP
jgi:hypothetical protein